MKKQNNIKKFSDDAAGEVIKEFTWSLASAIHRSKSADKALKRARKKPVRRTNSNVKKTGVAHQC